MSVCTVRWRGSVRVLCHLNVNLHTKVQKKSHPQCPLQLIVLYIMWEFPIPLQLLYDLHMYVYICLYTEVHTWWLACMPVMHVMHIYRYIIKNPFTYFVKGWCFMLSAHISSDSPPYSQHTGRQGWRRSLPQVQFPSIPSIPPIIHYASDHYSFCLTAAAMTVVNTIGYHGDTQSHIQSLFPTHKDEPTATNRVSPEPRRTV